MEGIASKHFQSPWPFTQQLLWFPDPDWFQIQIPGFQILFTRLGKIRHREGRIPTGKVKL